MDPLLKFKIYPCVLWVIFNVVFTTPMQNAYLFFRFAKGTCKMLCFLVKSRFHCYLQAFFKLFGSIFFVDFWADLVLLWKNILFASFLGLFMISLCWKFHFCCYLQAFFKLFSWFLLWKSCFTCEKQWFLKLVMLNFLFLAFYNEF